MKNFNVFFSVLTTVIIMLSVSCGGESSSSNDNAIIGEWKIVKAEGSAAASNEGMVYALNNDGTAKVGSGMMTSEYTYTTSQDTLTMNFQGGTDIVLTWTFKIDGNKMEMQNTTSDQKFWLEK